MSDIKTAFLHYSAPPVVGGVEGVMLAHAQTFLEAGYPVSMIAGRGDKQALPSGCDLILVPELDSQHASILQVAQELERGNVPADFDPLVERLVEALGPILQSFDNLIVHNLFTKHFNLAATAALYRLLEAGDLTNCIAWCHDFTWTSSHSRPKVHSGYPWDLLRTYRSDMTYVVVSVARQAELAGLYGCPTEDIRVVYNGVDPQVLFGFSPQGGELIERLNLLGSDLILLMPVRVTQAKNIEFALQVVAALKDAGQNPKLILTGPPDPHEEASMDYYHSLQDLRRQLGVESEMRFIYESGPQPDEPLFIDLPVVGDLFRASDLMFMPSHREGFGMPVLEAGLLGIPVVTTAVPAAVEIGGQQVISFARSENAPQVAAKIIDWAESSPVHQLRRRVRQRYTWKQIFASDIEPLLVGEAGK
jgi:glycosyltransferase involved in cell wall biosynthesis